MKAKEPMVKGRLTKGVSAEDLEDWMSDNGLTERGLASLMNTYRAVIQRWLNTTRSIPSWMIPLMTYISRDLTKQGTAERCSRYCLCGCGGQTHRNIITRQFNMYLPGHSQVAKFRKIWDPNRMPTVIARLKQCPKCENMMMEGHFMVNGAKTVPGQQCSSCEYKHFLIEQSA